VRIHAARISLSLSNPHVSRFIEPLHLRYLAFVQGPKVGTTDSSQLQIQLASSDIMGRRGLRGRLRPAFTPLLVRRDQVQLPASPYRFCLPRRSF
jgi:hypothetical protein